MTAKLKKAAPAQAIPITVVDRAAFQAVAPGLPAASRQWLGTAGVVGAPDTHALLPGEDGRLARVFAGVTHAAHPFALSTLPMALPKGDYRLDDAGLALHPQAAALSWELGGYGFDLYKPARRAPATLWLKPGADAERGLAMAAAITATRDLVNTPAEHLGPAELAAAAKALAKQYGAKFDETVGDALLKKNFPSIHAVGRASTRPPRLVEVTWGHPKHPRLALVGKGVCFDSGGLNIKPGEGMRQMKKDMGGAANALGLAGLIMALGLPVRLQLLIPAVDNAIAGNAYRPGDVIKTRKGLHVEIGNTDAEGRVVLSDALAYAAEGKPDLVIDLATLTGAARVALGAQLPALFSKHMDTARDLVDLGLKLDDPLWHMPLWAPYHAGIESSIADLVNTGKTPLAGAINAALFLEDFLPPQQDWLHVDLFAWNDAPRRGPQAQAPGAAAAPQPPADQAPE